MVGSLSLWFSPLSIRLTGEGGERKKACSRRGSVGKSLNLKLRSLPPIREKKKGEKKNSDPSREFLRGQPGKVLVTVTGGGEKKREDDQHLDGFPQGSSVGEKREMQISATIPKTFLSIFSFFSRLLGEKRGESRHLPVRCLGRPQPATREKKKEEREIYFGLIPSPPLSAWPSRKEEKHLLYLPGGFFPMRWKEEKKKRRDLCFFFSLACHLLLRALFPPPRLRKTPHFV